MITGLGKNLRVVFGVIEVGLLEGQRKAGDIIKWAFHRGNVRPDHGAEVIVAKLQPAFSHAFEIPTGVILFFLESSQDALAKGIGSVREFEEGERHELDSKEFVVGEEVEENAALFLVVDLIGGGKRRFAMICPGLEMIGATGERRRSESSPARGIEV